MATTRAKTRAVHRSAAFGRLGSTAVSPHAMLAWSRVPSSRKAEILEAFEGPLASNDADVKTIKVGAQILKVRDMSSGFRVVYEPGEDHNTIVSVLTPREARLARA